MLFRAENSDLAHMGVISGEYSRYAIRDLMNRDMPSQYVGGVSGRSEGIVDR